MTANTVSGEQSALPGRELLELLADQYARRILRVLDGDPMAAQRIAETTGISKPTVYRRLDRLEQAGLVASELLFEPDGNHYHQYRTILERMTLRFGEDGPTISIRTDPHPNGCERWRENGVADHPMPER